MGVPLLRLGSNQDPRDYCINDLVLLQMKYGGGAVSKDTALSSLFIYFSLFPIRVPPLIKTAF